MAKSQLRLKAIELRKEGESVKVIAKKLNVAKSTVSLWVRDIILSVEQLEILKKRLITGGEKGRLLGALKQKNERLRKIQKYRNKGKLTFPYLNKKELMTAGVALYWAEGTKKKRELVFCNSDPKMIEFIIRWLRICFKVPLSDLRCVVGINEAHFSRDTIIKEYWSKITGVKLSRFNKTSFKKSKSKKTYANFNNYYGTLSIKVAKSSSIHYHILGLIEGLYSAKVKSQGSSVVVAQVS